MNRHGQWLRRRKIDGALNRVPPGFYQRLYQLLRRCRTLCIQNMCLDVSLTYEMTSGETKFALAVERIMNTIPTPEYRQLLVEALVMLGMVNEVDKKNLIDLDGQSISVDNLVSQAHKYFLKDQVSSSGVVVPLLILFSKDRACRFVLTFSCFLHLNHALSVKETLI